MKQPTYPVSAFSIGRLDNNYPELNLLILGNLKGFNIPYSIDCNGVLFTDYQNCKKGIKLVNHVKVKYFENKK